MGKLSALKPSKDSLFGVLTRSPWWLSLAIAAALFAIFRLFLPPLAAATAGLPFLAIAVFAAWRQMSAPSPASAAKVLEQLRALSAEQFCALLAEAYGRRGYAITPVKGGGADFELRKDARVSLVKCSRWKVAQTGIASLRELLAAKGTHAAAECIYIAAGEITANAQVFARENAIQLLYGVELAQMFARPLRRQAKTSGQVKTKAPRQ